MRTTPTTPSVSSDLLREICGEWVTGVCVVTGTDAVGTATGMAVNSFSSLSLDPPLVLFCAARSSWTWPVLREAGRFAVNILAADQHHYPAQFARRGADRFERVAFDLLDGLPVLRRTTAHLRCTLVGVLDGGDHEIAVGRVDAADRSGRPPLVYHRGRVDRSARP